MLRQRRPPSSSSPHSDLDASAYYLINHSRKQRDSEHSNDQQNAVICFHLELTSV
jgi:hypothetical protein